MSAAGLYLHLPFCSAICPYCDFAVLTGPPEKRRRFARTLETEIRMVAAEPAGPLGLDPPPGGWRFDTVYLGGGTPSLLEIDDLERLLAAVGESFGLDAKPWLALEANPEDVSAPTLDAWRELGFGAMSLGVQSFDDGTLAALGRKHSALEARQAVELARLSGFRTVSLDLIFAVPGQTLESWQRDLEQAIELGPHHVSCYQLTIHDGTAFGARRRRGELAEPANSVQADFFLATHETLRTAGYRAYEVSNFALAPEHESRHNRKYWRHEPYLGLGPSAHSFNGTTRWWNERGLPGWQFMVERGRRPVADWERLGAHELALESLMLGLRTTAGVDLAEIETRCALELEQPNRQLIEDGERQRLWTREGSRLLPTVEGLALADSLAASFRV